MATKIILKLSSEIITDFQACFPTKQEERRYLYQKASKKTNETLGEILKTKKVFLQITKNGVAEELDFTLDELNYYNYEIPSDDNWKPKEIYGELENYEILLTDSSVLKINNSQKIQFLTQNKINESNIEENEKLVNESKNDSAISEKRLENMIKASKKSKEIAKEAKEKITKQSLHFAIFFRIIMDKIQEVQKKEEDEEFEAMLKAEEEEDKKNDDKKEKPDRTGKKEEEE